MNRYLSFAALLLLIFALPVGAQSTAEVESKIDTQKWFGTLDVGVARLRLLMEVTTADDGTKDAVVFSVDQGNAKMQTDTFTDEDDKFEFTIDRVKASFSGKKSADGDSIVGKFTQAGVTRDLTLKRTDGVPEETLISAWTGDLKAGAQVLRVQVRELKSGDGETLVLFDSLTQRVSGMTAEMTIDGDKMTVKVPGAQATFEATLNDDKTEATGKWSQMGNTLDLVLSKNTDAEKAEPRNRPQTPKEPYSYQTKEVTFASLDSGVTLAGTLTYPSDGGPFPCVITVTGSGPQNRDEEIFGHKPFAVIADHLAKQGIATLRYDDRGTGKSTGSFSDSTTRHFANDAAGAIEFAKSCEQVDSKRIGMIGHSEGGLIATMLAERRDDLAHVVLMAGPGVSGEAIIYDQSKVIAVASGAADEYLEQQDQMLRELVAIAKAGDISSDKVNEIVKKYPLIGGGEENTILAAQMQQFATPWFKFFLDYDPGPVLAKAACPVFALIGEHDLQVTTGLNGPAIKAALENSPHNSKYVELAGLNHLFQRCTNGSPTEYDSIEQTLDPSLLTAITNWIQQH